MAGHGERCAIHVITVTDQSVCHYPESRIGVLAIALIFIVRSAEYEVHRHLCHGSIEFCDCRLQGNAGSQVSAAQVRTMSSRPEYSTAAGKFCTETVIPASAMSSILPAITPRIAEGFALSSGTAVFES